MKDIKQNIYETMKNNAALTTLLGGVYIYHYKKPANTPVGRKNIVYYEIAAGARIYEDKIDDEAYEISIEAPDPDSVDIIFEQVYILFQDKSYQQGTTGCHRLRLDWKSPDILLADQVTWQKIARFIAIIERK